LLVQCLEGTVGSCSRGPVFVTAPARANGGLAIGLPRAVRLRSGGG
jgi:hypothetical protein